MTRITYSLICVGLLTATASAQPPANPGRGLGAQRAGGAGAAGAAGLANRPSPQTLGSRGLGQASGGLNQLSRRPDVSTLSRGLEQRNLKSRKDDVRVAGQDRRSPNADARQSAPPVIQMVNRQLASIERLRDQAIETGDLSLLERADLLEQQFRADVSGSQGRQAAMNAIKGWAIDPATGERIPFGQLVSRIARQSGREFGQFTSQQARELGSEFGQQNASKTRLFPELPPSEPGTLEPLPSPETEPETFEPLPTFEPDQPLSQPTETEPTGTEPTTTVIQ